MVTFTHIMILTSLIGIFLCFLWGKTHKEIKFGTAIVLLLTTIGFGVICSAITFFVHTGCEYINFCAPSHPLNPLRLLPIIGFSIFWVAILVGYAARGQSNA